MSPGSAVIADSARVTVVGGGIAGLVAAIACAETGLSVVLYEARPDVGGRARSTAGQWQANFGPHALCSRRSNWRWLKQRGLLPDTAWIPPTGSSFHYHGKLHWTPPLPLQVSIAKAWKSAPADLSFSEWGAAALGRRATRWIAKLAGASFSYHHDPGRLSAAFVWDRIRWLFIPPSVDMVAADGLLSEVAFNSALEAARLAALWSADASRAA